MDNLIDKRRFKPQRYVQNKPNYLLTEEKWTCSAIESRIKSAQSKLKSEHYSPDIKELERQIIDLSCLVLGLRKEKEKIIEKYKKIDKEFNILKEENSFLQQNNEWFKQNFYNQESISLINTLEAQIDWLANICEQLCPKNLSKEEWKIKAREKIKNS